MILGAACVALMCDFLKRNNEQLRELTIEMKIRHEEAQRRSQIPVKVEKIAPAPEAAAPKQRVAMSSKKRTVNSEALAAMERGAALASSGGRHHSTPSAAAAKSEPAVKPGIARKDWGSLLSRNAQAKKPNARPALPPVELAPAAGLLAGYHDGHVLNKLVQSHQPVTGLVVSIGVEADGKLPESVHRLVQSLIGPEDFAAQSAEDEFLLIYPREQGASAQRRLSRIAQQLWDFQLRSLGSFQILFSWGGVEVRSESIDEAIASASERMQETSRGRRLLAKWTPAPPETRLRRAV